MALTYWRGHVQVDIRHWNQKQSLQCKLTSILKDNFFWQFSQIILVKNAVFQKKKKERKKNTFLKGNVWRLIFAFF